MDPQRFDGLARSLANVASRRRALGLLAAGGLAALGGVAGADAKSTKKKKKCKHGHKLCSGVCVNVRNDPKHCGSCNHACAPNETCKAGSCVCVPQCTGKTCGPDGCSGSCGTCAGPVCQGTTLTTQSCDAGVCTSNQTNCGAGQVCFNNACCTKRAEPSCHKTAISDGCGGTYQPNCTHNCCDNGSGKLVCQTNPCQ